MWVTSLKEGGLTTAAQKHDKPGDAGVVVAGQKHGVDGSIATGVAKINIDAAVQQ